MTQAPCVRAHRPPGVEFRFRAEKLGNHVHVRVFAGPPGCGALLGSLTMSEAEWRDLREILDDQGSARHDTCLMRRHGSLARGAGADEGGRR